MAKTYQFTEQELANAFTEWDCDYLENPDDFGDITEDSGNDQAKTLIKYLEKN